MLFDINRTHFVCFRMPWRDKAVRHSPLVATVSTARDAELLNGEPFAACDRGTQAQSWVNHESCKELLLESPISQRTQRTGLFALQLHTSLILV